VNEGRTQRPIYHFASFILDLERGALLAASGAEVSLRPKAFSLLRLFVENAGRLVDRSMIIEALWSGTVVTDESIAQCIKDVRRALGGETQHLVTTVRGRGYRLEATVVDQHELRRRPGGHAADLRVERERDEDVSAERVRGDGIGHPPDGQAEAERRLMTVMSCGLVEAAALTLQSDPEDLRQVIVACHRAVAASVAQHGGQIAEYHGDSVLARFGWPIATEDDPERAIRAALSAVKAVECLEMPSTPRPLHVRIGIATGPTIAEDGETHVRSMFGVIPMLAAQLQAAADPGTVLVSEMTWRLVGALFDCEESRGIAGKIPPIRAWRILSEGSVDNRFAALRASSLAALPLIGRDEEQEIFLRRWERACAGDGQVVLISGEPGIGKSRLNAAFQAAVARIGRSHERQDWFCLPHLQHSELHPIVAQLERAADFKQEDPPATKFDKLATLPGSSGWTSDDVRLVAGLLGVAPGNQEAGPMVTLRRQRELLLEALLRRVETLSQARPLLAVLEDAHWADPTMGELLDLLVARIASLPALLVLTHRPTFQAPWVGEAHVTELRLSRLNQRQCAALIGHVAHDRDLPSETVAAIIERADGVPLFLEELTKVVLERTADGAALSADTDMGVPTTLQSSLLARLDRLGPTAREVAQAGAAIGRAFSYDLLRSIVDLPEPTLLEALSQLASSGLVHVRGRSTETTYTFKHALVQDVANGLLLRERRRILHGRIVESLRGRDNVPPEFLAWHCSLAGFADQAIAQWRLAGERSVARFANLEAKEHYQRALELLQSLPASPDRDRCEADLCLAQVVPFTAIYGFGSQAVETCALRARELSASLDPQGRFLAHRVVWNSSLMRHPLLQTVGLARDLVSLANRDGDAPQRAAAHRALGYSLSVIGDLEEADRILQQGIALADTAADAAFLAYGENPQIVCRLYRGYTLSLLGYPETGLRVAEEGVARARLRNDPHAIAWSLNALTRIAVDHRNVRLVAQASAEAEEICRRHSLPQWLALAEMRSGWAACVAGETNGGLALLQSGHRRWEATGAKLHTTQNLCHLAEGYITAGMPQVALEHLAAARRHGMSFDELVTAAEISLLTAVALQDRDAPVSEAEAELKQALEVARHQKARWWELRAALGLARLYCNEERNAEARCLLAPIYARFTEGFALPDLVEAGTLLADLGIRSAPDRSLS
jgi:class 3 adenylate cyclase/tetratricopeptide (TPR) repeat protein